MVMSICLASKWFIRYHSFPMPWNDDTITPKVLLGHIQSGFESLRTEFRRELESLKNEERIAAIEEDIPAIKTAVGIA